MTRRHDARDHRRLGGFFSAGRLAAVVCLLALPVAAQRVLLVSFDGLGYQTLKSDPVAQELHTFERLMRQGTTFEGIQPAFPSTTANSHAAIWTGAYGDVSSISFNSNPLSDRTSRTFLDRENGFRSSQLTAEPIWVTAARQGKTAVAHQATQAFPFLPVNTAPGAVVMNGYQTKQVDWYRIIDPSKSWTIGEYRLSAAKTGAGFRVCVDSGDCVDVRSAPVETEPPRNRELARHFSKVLMLPGSPPLGVHYRLFAGKLLQTHVQELALHDGKARNDGIVAELIRSEGAFAPNGASRLHTSGQLNDHEYLETVEFQIRQSTRHAAWLAERFHPDLMQSYLPFPDENDHEWLGRARAGDAHADELRRWAYVAIDRGAEALAALAKGSRDTIVFVSDHGMMPVRKMLNVGAVLRAAGLADSASYLYYAILLKKPETIERVREALAAVRDPDTGAAIVTGFYTPAEHGERYGIGGKTGGDLYFDLLPGYAASDIKNSTTVIDTPPAKGSHGFLPTRDDMLAICVARGPRFAAGATRPRQKSINIAPMVSDLLGIEPPHDARGKSPLGWE